MSNEQSQKAFEVWATGILGDNPNWPESGDGELARQSWEASRKALEAEITLLRALIQKAQSDSELIEYKGKAAIVVPYSFMRAATQMPEQVQAVEPVGYWLERAKELVEIFVEKPRDTSPPAQQVAVPPEANLFWNAVDAEQCYHGIGEFLNDEICNGSLEVGDFRTIQRAVRLPNIMIRVTSIDEEECDADYEIVESAPQPPQGDTL